MNPRHLLHTMAVLSFATTIAGAQNQPSRPREPAAAQQPAPSAVPTPEPLPQNANDFIRQAVDHELAEQDRDHSHWRYLLHREDDKGTQDRDVVETGEGSLSRTLLKFGRPLTPEERALDEARMQKQISDPGERAKHSKREKDDAEKAKSMLKAIPDAFVFQYDGEEDGLVQLNFTPNPRYNPPTRELRVFHALRGKIWIDRSQKRLARVEGSLFEDVTFAFGLLGRLDKGGTFKVVQQQVAPEHWEVVSLDINMNGRAIIFKTINVKHRQQLSDFQRVSDSLTLHQAYEMLLKSGNPASATNHASTVRAEGKN
ncbi:MAG TPA: hypothetical protein VKL40_01000 [Candidatus Angelobacter sp.]|nr:hypothetical protein [Candidatus Angelobacter sp.]